MKKASILFAIALLFLASSCGNRKDEKTPVTLPEIAENQQVVFENDTIRIIDDYTDMNQNHIIIQPKFEEIKGIDIASPENEYEVYEGLLDGHLVTSVGTGNVRDLRVYNAADGKMLIEQSGFTDTITPDNDGKGFLFFILPEPSSTIYWNAETGTWDDESAVPAQYRGEPLQQGKAAAAEYVFNGYPLGLHVEYHADMTTGEVEPTGGYQWTYVE